MNFADLYKKFLIKMISFRSVQIERETTRVDKRQLYDHKCLRSSSFLAYLWFYIERVYHEILVTFSECLVECFWSSSFISLQMKNFYHVTLLGTVKRPVCRHESSSQSSKSEIRTFYYFSTPVCVLPVGFMSDIRIVTTA